MGHFLSFPNSKQKLTAHQACTRLTEMQHVHRLALGWALDQNMPLCARALCRVPGVPPAFSCCPQDVYSSAPPSGLSVPKELRSLTSHSSQRSQAPSVCQAGARQVWAALLGPLSAGKMDNTQVTGAARPSELRRACKYSLN